MRWGRTVCPSITGTDLVYEGITAGTWYQTTGGGANYLCMTKHPKYFTEASTGNRGTALLYGTEYGWAGGQTSAMSRFDYHNVPCAVCEVSSRSRYLLIPGTYECPSGWTKEYEGWLMTAHSNHKGRTTFNCVDKNPESIPGSAALIHGTQLCHIEAECHGLPCPPYDQRKELSCVVCTK